MIFPFAIGLALSSIAAQQTEVTIYNQGFGFIKELRELDLKQGRQLVQVENVAALIEPNSVGVRSLTDPTGLEVLEQNYQYDLINAMAILNKSVGSQIRLLRILPNGQKEIVEGTLLSAPTAIVNDGNGASQTYNGMVIRSGDSILLNPSGEISVSSIPEGMISKPTLVWDLESQRGGKQTIELSYLSQGMGWNADYVLTLDGAQAADLKGWVTLRNNCGVTFKDAKLKLLAGDVQRAQQPTAGGRGGAMKMEAMADRGFAEETLFEYHLYTLQRPATVRNNEMKQVSLLEGKGIKVQKKLIVDSMRDFGMYYPQEGAIGTGPIKPMVRVEFVNSKENSLGMPMPQGKMKVYQRDKSGSVQMLGEDSIQHTPKGELISLFVGRSFDIVAERKRTSFHWLGSSNRGMTETFEIELRNRKETNEQVIVLERHYGDWKITEHNLPFTKEDSGTAQFVVDLKAGEIKKLVYTVETRW